MSQVDYIGSGLRFPMGVNAQGRLAVAAGSQKIEQSIRLILSTALTERVMRHDFGCEVWDFVFAPITAPMLSQLESATRLAITRWEPRVEVTEVTAEQDPAYSSKVLIDLHYNIAPTNEARNLVYPFYVIPREDNR